MEQKSDSDGSRTYRAYELAAEGCVLSIIYLFILGFGTSAVLLLVAVGLNMFDYEPSGVTIAVGVVVSAIPSLIFLYFHWKGYKLRRAADLQARKDAELRKQEDGEAAAQNSVSVKDLIDGLFEVVGGLFVLAVGALVLVVVGFVAYWIVTSISTPVAILLGAVFIGLCILVAASS